MKQRSMVLPTRKNIFNGTRVLINFSQREWEWRHRKVQKITFIERKPWSSGKGIWDSHFEGLGFKSLHCLMWSLYHHHILDGHFFTLICCKNCIDICLKKTVNKLKRLLGWWPIKHELSKLCSGCTIDSCWHSSDIDCTLAWTCML